MSTDAGGPRPIRHSTRRSPGATLTNPAISDNGRPMLSSPPRFVGRTAVLESVLRRAGSGRSVLVSGPTGIGRSRLLAETATRLEHQGLRVERLTATGSGST